MRIFLAVAPIVVLLFGLLSFSQQSPISQSPAAPLSAADVEHGLKAGVSTTRMAALVKQYGVDFELNDAIEKELRAAGATGDLLLEISRSKHSASSSPIPSSISNTTPIEAPASGDIPLASNPEGRALAAKVAQAMGGIDKLQSVKSVRMSGTTNNKDGTWVFEDIIVYPDRQYFRVETPHGTMISVVSPESFFTSIGGVVRYATSEYKESALFELHNDPVYLLQRVNDPAITFAAAGSEKIGDVEVVVVDTGDLVRQGGVLVNRWYVDPESGRILRSVTKGTGSGVSQTQTDNFGWRTADGLAFPYLRKLKSNGEHVSTYHLTSIEINPTVDPKLFDKPNPGSQSEGVGSSRSDQNNSGLDSNADASFSAGGNMPAVRAGDATSGSNGVDAHDCISQGVTMPGPEDGRGAWPEVALRNRCSRTVIVRFAGFAGEQTGGEWTLVFRSEIKPGKSTTYLEMGESKFDCLLGKSPNVYPDPNCSRWQVVWTAAYKDSNQEPERPNVPRRTKVESVR